MAAPAEGITLRQHLASHCFHGGQRLAGTVTRRGATGDLGSGEGIETGDQIRGAGVFQLGDRRQRHHAAVGRAYVNLLDVVGAGTVFRGRLHDDLPHLAVQVELADVQRAEQRLHGTKYIVDRHPQSVGLFAIQGHIQLLRGSVDGGSQAPQFRALAGLGDEILGHLRQLLDVATAATLNPELETAGGAQTGN